MFAEGGAAAAGFDADELDVGVGEELVEGSDGVGAAAYAGDDGGGELALGFEDLFAGFAADDAVEVADHGGVGVGSEGAAEDVVGGADVGDPVAHGLVDGVLEGGGACAYAADFGSEEAHAVDVELLAAHVFLAHVDDAFEAEEGADGGGGDAVLAGSGLGDDALLAHALGEEALADGVVDLVGAGVEEVFALEVDFGSAEFLGEAAG